MRGSGTGTAGEGDHPGGSTFARAWATVLTGTTYLPMTPAELHSHLCQLTGRLAGALRAEAFDPHIGHLVGTDLVRHHITSPEALGRTIEIIESRLLSDLGLPAGELNDRLARLLGAVSTGYAHALRERTLDEQESVRHAALVAREQAERELRGTEARLRYQATHDPLTGLPNRALFAERLEALFAEPEIPGRRIGLCLLDLDDFKIVNDTRGHDVGDLLLVRIADRLRRRLPDHLIARTGVDEFVVLLTGTTGVNNAVTVGRTVLDAATETARLAGHNLAVSASVGVVERPLAGGDPSDLLRAADVTLHRAKATGKGRLAVFDPVHDEREIGRWALSAQLPAAIDRNDFQLDYQPLISLENGALLGAEALVRWRHPRHGLLYPERFIALAEETGLIVRLGSRLLARACRQALAWHTPGRPEPYVSVNLAVRQVHDPGLVGEVTRSLSDTGLPPGRLQLEITESALMDTADEPLRALRRIADLGVRVAIDDFGTGYSNLAYLRRLPVCELKLAGSFVEGLRTAPAARTARTDERILATLVSLAHTLNLTVTAEGVETVAQAELLQSIGCDAAQGWHFGRPGPPASISALLTQGFPRVPRPQRPRSRRASRSA